jgi:hypothetical protein
VIVDKCTDKSKTIVSHQSKAFIGTLQQKRKLSQNSKSTFLDLDWALCALNMKNIRPSNSVLLSNRKILFSKNIAEKPPMNMVVLINTGPSGVMNGFMIGDYSLVALPGRKSFQRMWGVILERKVGM